MCFGAWIGSMVAFNRFVGRLCRELVRAGAT